MNSTSFSSLDLSPAMLANLAQLGYHEMTSVQAASLPAVLDRRDLIAQARTGSGKTAAFGIGMLQRINPAWFAIQGLVLCPTRELADQVANELRRLARFAANVKVLTLTGGMPMRPQIASLEHGAHIVVGTPGRLADHIQRRTIDLSRVQTLVLDEADRMTDMGFYEEMAGIVAATPARRQTLLFSATYPDDIRQATAPFLRDPVEVRVASRHDDSAIAQRFVAIGAEAGARGAAVAALLDHFRPQSTLAFCNTKAHCRDLADALRERGYTALALYGELEQRERDEILVLFANGSCTVLVATDVAARGLDIQQLGAVINADISRDTDVHIHRIGRSGRGSHAGLALTLVGPGEAKWVKAIEQDQGAPVIWEDLAALTPAEGERLRPAMRTLCIQGGKKDKLRPGDLLGALTGEAGLTREQVGKINVFEFMTYVALERSVAEQAAERLIAGTIKGRPFRMRFVDA